MASLRSEPRKHLWSVPARPELTLDEVQEVYQSEMLSTRGHAELAQYEERLKLVLGAERMALALDMLTEAAVTGCLGSEAIKAVRGEYEISGDCRAEQQDNEGMTIRTYSASCAESLDPPVPPRDEDEFISKGNGAWHIVLRWSIEAIAAAAYEMTFWYMAAVLQAVTDEDAEDYLLRNSPKFWRLIESRRAQAVAGRVVAFDPAVYGGKGAAAAVVRETRASYGSGRRRNTGKGTPSARTKP